MENNFCNSNHHNKNKLTLARRWLFSLIFIPIGLFLIKPLIVSQLFYRASSYFQYGLFNDVLRQYQKAIIIDRYNENAWNHLILTYDLLNNTEKMIETAQRAVKIKPDNRNANFILGRYFLEKKQYEEAIKYLEKVYNRGPESQKELNQNLISYYKFARDLLAICYKKTNQEEKLKNLNY